MTARARLDAATADLDPPLAVVDLDALDANADDLVRRAGGRPVRVASKSVRCRAVLRRVLARPGFAGVLAYSLAEALWLAGGEDPVSDDVVVGYPSADRSALRRLVADPVLAARVTLVVDSPDHLDLVDAVAAPGRRPPVRVCLDLDASLRAAGGRVHLGVRRSPVHDPAGAAALARAVHDRPGFRLAGLMAYEAQVAGVPDAPPGRPLRALAVRGVQALSMRELARRRAAAVAAVSAVAPLEFVNGGGTGSLERTAADPAVTELAAGSGLYRPTLFDGYRTVRGEPALLFALAVTRRPAPGIVTVAAGGWIASGPPGPDRSPRPVHPAGLRLLGTEGAGEVQTPLRGPGARGLAVGDRVWFRHAKAGEVCEHVDVVHTLAGDRLTGAVPTYRGEGRAFG
ncbi:D-serine deaminase, pyridoxal phosphate-dependent [Geodermatophilus saharensis]|uniref:D-serine deaminase, pyridoxal phosphate-dependent n=1 Tax=Geodermatophilus saharensis TaxID=1137994 RepID=A0A239J084_9ACTN|nr:amino acid deaminase/aldolase [Geodermatophilus saharensis]SNS99311.1 D-serine deaminase, pyridoxal phosphate-dependent [Geodermatophilus saharensis]